MTDPTGLNDDFNKRVVIDTNLMDWQASPSPNVWRKRLHHSGPAEAGVVTSIVRYEPGSEFPAHPHPDGEEIFVLDGIFSDDSGDYPAGTYILNPEGFSHAPSSGPGCTLFVKLRQYTGARLQVRKNSKVLDWRESPDGQFKTLLLDDQEGFLGRTELIRILPDAKMVAGKYQNGTKIFVLEGAFGDESGDYSRGFWIRNPPANENNILRTRDGCTLLLKSDCFS
tara:strand:- start:84618 stop:85292 length:675 start_codon:yes stop_codon:yes gene_type:complete